MTDLTASIELAERTFETHIVRNAYPGRGIVAGRAEDGGFLFVYWIMGRSAHSQNRRFAVDGTTLRTEPVDASKVDDPSLIIYEAMLEAKGVQLVSNGDQTRTALTAIEAGRTFDEGLATREREPDAPNFTPRISAMLDFRGGHAPALQLSLLKANPFDSALTDRVLFAPALPPSGFGVGLTTYMGDGSPLPSFVGDPLTLPLRGEPGAILAKYFDALNEDNRISVAVKHMDERGRTVALRVRNRFA